MKRAATSAKDFRCARGSDLDSVVSVRTEDFEHRFSSLVLRPPKSAAVLPPPNPPVQPLMSLDMTRPSDSDLETIASQDFVKKYWSTMVGNADTGSVSCLLC